MLKHNNKRLKEIAKELIDKIPVNDRHIWVNFSHMGELGGMVSIYESKGSDILWNENIHSHWSEEKIAEIVERIEKRIEEGVNEKDI